MRFCLLPAVYSLNLPPATESKAGHGDGSSRIALDSIKGQVYVGGLPEHRDRNRKCSLTSDVNGNQDGVRVLRSGATQSRPGEDIHTLICDSDD